MKFFIHIFLIEIIYFLYDIYCGTYFTNSWNKIFVLTNKIYELTKRICILEQNNNMSQTKYTYLQNKINIHMEQIMHAKQIIYIEGNLYATCRNFLLTILIKGCIIGFVRYTYETNYIN
jgi:hypothetical protein